MNARLVQEKPASFGRFALIIMLALVFFFGLAHSSRSEDLGTDVQIAPHTPDVYVDGLSQAERAAEIDNFFAERRSPLAGFGMKFVTEADKYGDIDWRLTAAIATIESNGAKQLCKSAAGQFNPFGFGSCHIGFKNFDDAISTVTQHLAGENPNTSKYYDGKTTVQILHIYNPESIRPGYAKMVMNVMDMIAHEPTVRVDNQLAIK